MSAISFAKVSKRFGKVPALTALDLDIAAGEFISLLGPSGSGKTTTLNLLAGLLPIDEGEIRIGDRIVNDVPPDKRDIAMVFQNYALYPHMTVHENIAFPLRARGRQYAEARIEESVGRVAKSLGISDLLARYPKELSGGQQQRVALGRAMVRDPKVFLLDEPLSNLDARLRLRMRRDLKTLHESLSATIVYVTHDQAEAMTLSTRVAIFNQGRLQQFDTPESIYHRPANMFVANFVGDREINLLHGELVAEDGVLRARSGGIVLPIDVPSGRLQAPAHGKVVIGVRAEGILPVEAAGPGDTPATVLGTEQLGAETVVFAAIADGTELCCKAAPDGRFAKGQAIGLRFLPRHIHLFDAESQASLRAQSST